MTISEIRGAESAEVDAFSEFDRWWEQYAEAPESARPNLVETGVKLAAKRRDAMLTLIESDPKAAISLAFAEEYHNALPPGIAPSVETHVRGLAELKVLRDRKGSVSRTVVMEDQRWQAYVFGPRLKLDSREEIPIHGVVLGEKMAVDGSPLERFPHRESLVNVLRQGEGKKVCPICDEPGTIPGAVGDILLWFDSDEHLVVCEKALIEKEMAPGASP